MSPLSTSFFERFPDFDHHPRRSIRDEFNRLSKTQNWNKHETSLMRAACYHSEFESHFANLSINDQLQRLQHLCVELDIEPLNTITQCKKALKNVHVNLVDLMDARRTGKKVKKFASHKKLVEYTLGENKVFPKQKAKCDVIKVLLKQIVRQR